MTLQALLIARPDRLASQGVEELERVFRASATDDVDLSVRATSEARAALDLIAEEPLDLVIADLVQSRPGRGGATLLRTMKEIRPDCRTILVTDHAAMRGLTESCIDAVLTRSPEKSWLSVEDLGETLHRLLEEGDLDTEITPTELIAASDARFLESDVLAGKYRLGKILGKGGMGVVYQAEDIFIKRRVALKVLRLEDVERIETVERRMMREVKIAGRLSHPGIVTLHDAGVYDERIYLVMELVQGETLNQKLRRGPLLRRQALQIADEILSALAHAHRKGVVHRDLKPANILFTRDGHVKITDFGVAKLVSWATGEEEEPGSGELFDSKPITLEGAMVGTLSYMAPEQILGEVDARADLYAVGLLLFEMVHGERLARYIKPLARAAELTTRPDEPASIPAVQDRAIDKLLERALAVRPEERFASAEEFLAALRRLMQPKRTEPNSSKGGKKEDGKKNSGWRRLLPWSLLPWGLLSWSLVLCCLIVLGCVSPPESPREFHSQLRGAPFTLDPVRSTSIYTLSIVDRLFDGLIRYDRPTSKAAPDLARSWEISADGREYLFKLREDALFHQGRGVKGRGVTAHDVKYSWERLLAPETASPHVYLLENIVGATEFHAGEAGDVEGVEAVEDFLLRVRLRKPMPAFLLQLGVAPTVVVPRGEVERLGEQFGRSPVGSGPFRFHRWSEDFRIELKGFKEYPEPPWVDLLVFHVVPDADEAVGLFREGRLDLAPQIAADRVEQLRREMPASVKVLPSIGWGGFGFRTDLPPFDDVRVRRAVSLAIDRNELARRLDAPRHTANAGLIPPNVSGAAEHEFQADPEQARALLAEAGYPEGRGLPQLLYAARLGTEPVAEFVISELAQIGLDVRTEAYDFQQILDGVREGRFPFFYLGWTGGFPDAEIYLRPIVHSRGGVNLARYSNPQVDAWIDQATYEPDLSIRMELYRQAEEKVLADAAYVVLYQWEEAFLLSDRWTGIPLGLRAEFLEIEKARPAR